MQSLPGKEYPGRGPSDMALAQLYEEGWFRVGNGRKEQGFQTGNFSICRDWQTSGRGVAAGSSRPPARTEKSQVIVSKRAPFPPENVHKRQRLGRPEF